MTAVAQKGFNFSGRVVDKTDAGFITKVTLKGGHKFFVFKGVQPTDKKAPAGIPTLTLVASREELGHTIAQLVKLTTHKAKCTGPAKGRAK